MLTLSIVHMMPLLQQETAQQQLSTVMCYCCI